MKNDDVLVAVFKSPITGSLLGYTYVGKELIAMITDFPRLEFIITRRSALPGLEQLTRLNVESFAKHQELRSVLAVLDRKAYELRDGPSANVAETFINRLTSKIVTEALKAKKEQE